MPEGPRHPIAVALHIAFVGFGGTEYGSDLTPYTGLFGDADYHELIRDS